MVYFLIPAHEEEETIGLLLYKLRSVMKDVRRDYLAIVFDDGSRDATAQVAEKYRKFLPVRVLKHAKNNGFGPALDRLVRESCRLSRYPQRDIAITIEADFSWSPDPVPAMVREIEAGADIFLMPSRFEPCGLNQIYSLRYGTVPVVRRTGGLADTIVDTTPETLEDKTATGFCFDRAEASALWSSVERALDHYRKPECWAQIVDTGMRQDFSWKRSAQQYVELYTRVLNGQQNRPSLKISVTQ